jgi:hypothetical protein
MTILNLQYAGHVPYKKLPLDLKGIFAGFKMVGEMLFLVMVVFFSK